MFPDNNKAASEVVELTSHMEYRVQFRNKKWSQSPRSPGRGEMGLLGEAKRTEVGVPTGMVPPLPIVVPLWPGL